MQLINCAVALPILAALMRENMPDKKKPSQKRAAVDARKGKKTAEETQTELKDEELEKVAAGSYVQPVRKIKR
jgi:hypothetical protein